MAEFNLNEVPSQKGRIAVVTGANIGLGYETTLGFIQKGMKVIMASRNLEKAQDAKTRLLEEVPDADLEIMQIDLSSLDSVRTFAKNYLDKYDKLDILVNNAGVMIPPYTKTEDGFELQFGVNHLGHFLLTGLLFETIVKTPNSRIVSLSSNAHKGGKLNFDDLQSEKKYAKMAAYNQSKLACLMFAYELDRRLRKAQKSTLSVAAHPGASDTNLGQYIPQYFAKILKPLLYLTILQSAKAGTEPTLYAALGESVEGGDYFGPSGFAELKGRAKKVSSTKRSHNKENAAKLWAVSEELTGFKFSIQK